MVYCLATIRVYRRTAEESTRQTTKLSAVERELGAATERLLRSHLVASELLGIDGLEPAAQALGLVDLTFLAGSRGTCDDRVLDEDRNLDPESKGHRVGGARVDRELLAVPFEMDARKERVVA